MNGYILDSSFLSAFCNKDDSNHDVALEIAKNFNISSPILIPVVVFAEISRIPFANLREKTLKICLDTVDYVLELEETEILDYLDFSKYLPKSCTAIDSLLLYFASSYGCKLITFDKGLLRLV